MLAPLLLAAVVAFLPQPPPDPPRAVIRHVQHAIQGDSVVALRARWLTRVERDPNDAGALLGLATLAKESRDWRGAEVLYARLKAAARPHAPWRGTHITPG